MSETNSSQQNELRLAKFNRIASIIIGGVVLAVGGVAIYQNRDQVPDRNKLWADYWQKELSKPSALPEMKSAISTEFSDVKFDASAFQPQSFEFDESSFRTNNGSSRTHFRKSSSRSRAR